MNHIRLPLITAGELPTRRHLAPTFVMLVFAALAVATLIPVWRAPGWPMSHELNFFALRTHIYARHFSWLDLMPIWSSADVSGFGSPLPLMYHKLFYMLAGVLALVTGSLKSADVTALALLLVAGATGMYLTMRALGTSRLAAAIAGCCLMTANYTVTNWLVRGAMAEFSAAMVTPWVLLFFVRTIRSGRVTIGLGVALGLMWLSHSVVAYYAGLILAATYVLLAVFRQAPWSVLNPWTAWPSVVCFVGFVGPYLAPMAILGRNYDFNRILAPPWKPIYQFRPVAAYLWDQDWHFGRTVLGLTVQLDHAMLLLLVVSLCALPGPRRDAASGTRWRILQPALPFFIVAALGSFLQLPAANPFYEWVPGAAFIQFPWRLLTLITPSLIVAALYLADTALPRDARSFALGGAVTWMLVSSAAFVPLQYPRIPIKPELAGVTFSLLREYEPRTAAPVAETQAKLSARWTEAGCSYENVDKSNDEVPSAQFHTSCGRAAVLPLPLYASPLHAVSTSTYARSQPCLRLSEFPGVCGAVIPAADSTVSVKLPTVASLARWAWGQRVATIATAMERMVMGPTIGEETRLGGSAYNRRRARATD